MSEYKAYEGKIKHLGPKKEGETLEDRLKKIVKEKNIEIDNDYSTLKEFFVDQLYNDYVVIGESVYEILRYDNFEEGDIFKAVDNKDGTIDFVVRFYNGGMCFEEAIEEAVNNMDRGDKSE